MMNEKTISKVAETIAAANRGKAAYVGMNEEGLFLSHAGNYIKTRSKAMRLVNPQRFIDMGLKPVLVKKATQ
ncbi:hypothetical protein [Vibrio parahaemolyticus]|uniref:hypothetical protein n=1 Tax=Vibrio parahaemolyticus TaxID=670 RepID=UPI00301CB0FB